MSRGDDGIWSATYWITDGVLYLSTGEISTTTVEVETRIILRYNEDRVIGVTIFDVPKMPKAKK